MDTPTWPPAPSEPAPGPAAPTPAWGSVAWPPPAAPGRPHHRWLGAAFGAGLITSAAALLLYAQASGLTRSASPSVSTPTGPYSTSPFSGGGFGSLSGGGGDSTGGTGTSGASVDASSIAAKVDPAIVDVTSTLAGGDEAAGTGMVITSGGEVLTNNHVIDGAIRVVAQIDGTGPLHPVRVVAADPADDVALLQIEGVSNLKTVSIGDSSNLAAGQAVVAIGNALGRDGQPSVAAGQVAALGQTITATDDTGSDAETLNGLIQVTASVVPGDSGGPLVDTSGHVIGMDTAASMSGRRRISVSSVGFAIPINSAMAIVHQMQSGAYAVPKSSNGGSATAPSGSQALLGVEVEDGGAQPGALIVGVEAGTPADSAGLTAGDDIVSLGGTAVGSASDLSAAIGAHHPGDRVEVDWLDQSGQQHSATVQLAAAGSSA
jgi:S1-C subfamily serine protease